MLNSEPTLACPRIMEEKAKVLIYFNFCMCMWFFVLSFFVVVVVFVLTKPLTRTKTRKEELILAHRIRPLPTVAEQAWWQNWPQNYLVFVFQDGFLCVTLVALELTL